MAIELVVIKTEDNGVTSEQINRLKLSLDRERTLIHDGFQMARLNVVTDNKDGIITGDGLKITYSDFNDKVTNPDFLQILPHGGLDDLIGERTKTLVLNGSIIGRNLITSFIMDGIPEKGTTHETKHTFDKDTRALIEDNDLSLVEQTENWWIENSVTHYSPVYMGFIQGDTQYMYDAFMNDSVAIQEKYATFQEWWEDTFDGYTIPVELGLIGGYKIGDEQTNRKYNTRYEEKVRPTFPDNWRGLGGDEKAKYIEFDHEYRDITKQTSLLVLEGDEDPFTDRYLQLWIL